MSSEVQKGKKRGKAQYLGNAKRHKGGKQLEVGMQGILITCNMNERKCVGEAYSLLNEYGDLLYGAEKLGEKDDMASGSEEEEEDDDDVEVALKKEVDQIRTSTEKNLCRFQSVESGANNVVFIRTLNVEPEKLVHHILKDLFTTKKKKTRVILRMLPVTGTCRAFPEDLKKYAETFFEPWFKAPNKGTFQIVYKARNNNHMNRDEVIKDLADIALSAPSQAVKEEFSIAAGQLGKDKSEVKFGQVDITQEKDLGKEFKIQEFPTFKLFINGDRKQPIDCKGVRTAAAFVTWINRRIGHSFVLLNTTEQYESFIQSDTVSVVGFFKDLNSNLTQHFTETAKDVSEFPFGFVSNEDILTHVGITGNMVAIYKKEKPVRYLISEEEIKSKLDLIRSIRIYIMDVVTEYSLETSVTIFDVPVNNHILLFTSKTSDNFNIIYESYESTALEFRGQIIFVLVDTDEPRNGRLFEYFRITEVDTPAVRILNITSDIKYRMPADDVTFENVRNFCQRYLDGKAKHQKNSEEIPSDWDKHPVKVLVGKNFNKVAFNKSSDAFVMFYAPWNEESQELLPVWEDLGKRYMNNTNVTIAKIDCTANDIQLMVLDRYPYFRFFPVGSDNKSVRYTGGKTIKAFTEFLENEIKSSKTREEDSSESSSEDDTKKFKEEL